MVVRVCIISDTDSTVKCNTKSKHRNSRFVKTPDGQK